MVNVSNKKATLSLRITGTGFCRKTHFEMLITPCDPGKLQW